MIQFKNVSFTYGAFEGQLPIRAVDRVSFHVKKGSHVALLGRNGSGKSTIARLINGLLLPDEGIVLVDNMNTADSLDIVEIRRLCGMVFQNPDNQLIGATVADDVAFGPCNLELPVEEVHARVDESLKKAGLLELRDRAPHDLSGGQKQKLAIASILAMEPECIILDEATSMLDPVSRREIMALVLELKEKHGLSIVQITHHMEEAVLADYVYVVSDGHISLEGTPADVFDRVEQIRAEGLAIPTHIEIAHHIANATNTTYSPDEVFTFEGAVDFTRRAISRAWAQLSKHDVGNVDFTHHAISETCNIVCDSNHIDTSDRALSSIEFEQRMINETRNIECDSKHIDISDRARRSFANREAQKDDLRDATLDVVIDVRNLSFAYDSNSGSPITALDNVSLSVQKGEILGIVGHTGSGKSTLIQHMNGLIPSKKGTVFVLGHDLSERRVIRNIRRHVGLLFQYPEDQLFEETVALDIAFAPKQLKRTPEQVEKAVLRAARRLGVESIMHRSPFELSGGQRRRVAIAGVLAAEPDIVIMDEPAAGLDPAGRDELFADLLTLVDEGATLLIVSHDMETMARFCDRILVLIGGRIAGDGTPREITVSSSFLEDASLDMPASKRFLDCFSDVFSDLETDCFTAEDAANSLLRSASRSGVNSESCPILKRASGCQVEDASNALLKPISGDVAKEAMNPSLNTTFGFAMDEESLTREADCISREIRSENIEQSSVCGSGSEFQEKRDG